MYHPESTTEEVRDIAAELYADRYRYLLNIARRNAASEADAEEATQDGFEFFLADYDPAAGAPPLPWLTLVIKRRCWRLRDNAHLDRRVAALPESAHEEPTGLIERRPSDPRPLSDRIADRDEARRRVRRLKQDERTALVLKAAGFSYEEIGRGRSWTYTKTNRAISEGRAALREEVAR
jgi:DNA-directed RNA polymerase specialized sigma24 family protein